MKFIFVLLSIIYGALLCLVLCAPYGYYPLFAVILLLTALVFVRYKKNIKSLKLHNFFIMFVCFISAYIICSYIIFMPVKIKLPSLKNISKNKEAVIFYCEGEMEKYSPYYSNYFFYNAPYILKPIYAFRIKRMYRNIDVNPNISELTKVAQEVRNSLLNYKPYYFYIAFSGYTPNIKSAVNSALNDGCGNITIINYTNNRKIEEIFNSEFNMDYLISNGVEIKFTEPIYNSSLFIESITSRIKNLPLKYDGILLIDDNTQASSNIKLSLCQLGYNEKDIVIDTDINNAVLYFKSIEAKNILYVNLLDAGSGIRAEIIIPNKLKEYSNEIKITGIKSWGYDKNLVKASILEFLKLSR